MAITQELTRLYREYYANRLSLADYRYQRGLLLDSLVAVESVVVDDPEEDITVSRGEEVTVPEPEPSAQNEPRGSRWTMVAAVLVVLFAGTVYVVTSQLEQPDRLPTVGDSEPAATAPNVEPLAAEEPWIEPDVGQVLVEAFLEEDDWSAGGQQRFLDAWISLPAPDRIVAKGAIWFAPLADRLEYRISEAYEFSSAPDSDVELQQLYATAVGLGLTELAPTNWKPGLPVRSVPNQQAAAERVPEVNTVETPVDEVPVEPALASRADVDESVSAGVLIDGSGADESGVDEPATNGQLVDELVINESMENEPMVNEPMVNEPMVNESMDNEPDVDEQTVNEQVGDDPVSVEPGIVEAVAGASEVPEAPPTAPDSGLVQTLPLENEDACRAEQLQTRRRGCFDLLRSGGQGPSMRVIPSGSVSEVVVDMPFAISTTEVSRAEYVAFCDSTDVECPADPWPGENMPMVNVSRDDAEAYCVWLSAETGYSYRLPTEAEWEYAARAGMETEYPFGDEITAGQARFSSISSYDSPLPRSDRTTQRNEFGLWHVVGNVAEWVGGASDDDSAVTRGGSYADDADALRLSARTTKSATHRDATTGFRVLGEL